MDKPQRLNPALLGRRPMMWDWEHRHAFLGEGMVRVGKGLPEGMPRWNPVCASLIVPRQGDSALLDWRWQMCHACSQITRTPAFEKAPAASPPLAFRVLGRAWEDLDCAGQPILWDGDGDVCPACFSGVNGLWKPSKRGLVESSALPESNKEEGSPACDLLFTPVSEAVAWWPAPLSGTHHQ